jgi:hypothetical protein
MNDPSVTIAQPQPSPTISRPISRVLRGRYGEARQRAHVPLRVRAYRAPRMWPAATPSSGSPSRHRPSATRSGRPASARKRRRRATRRGNRADRWTTGFRPSRSRRQYRRATRRSRCILRRREESTRSTAMTGDAGQRNRRISRGEHQEAKAEDRLAEQDPAPPPPEPRQHRRPPLIDQRRPQEFETVSEPDPRQHADRREADFGRAQPCIQRADQATYTAGRRRSRRPASMPSCDCRARA